MGEVVAVGDHLQQSAESQPRSRNPWLRLMYQGLRAMINIMPNSYQINQNVNFMELYKPEHDKDLLDFSASYFRMMQDEGHYVWQDLSACVDMLGATYSSDLDRFVPDLAPKRNFTVSDSVLTYSMMPLPRSIVTETGPQNCGLIISMCGLGLFLNPIGQSEIVAPYLISLRVSKPSLPNMVKRGVTPACFRTISTS